VVGRLIDEFDGESYVGPILDAAGKEICMAGRPRTKRLPKERKIPVRPWTTQETLIICRADAGSLRTAIR
jgi:hypothetical protein